MEGSSLNSSLTPAEELSDRPKDDTPYIAGAGDSAYHSQDLDGQSDFHPWASPLGLDLSGDLAGTGSQWTGYIDFH
jgi:hypothetical protein